MQPDATLCDEMTAALDPETAKQARVTIRQPAEEGMARMLVTHETGLAREAAGRISGKDRSAIVEHGAPASSFAHPQDARAKAVLTQAL